MMRRSIEPRSLSPTRLSAAPAIDPTRVTAADVERLDVLQDLLTTLNDPRASASSLARNIDRSNVLKARIEALYRVRVNERSVPRLMEQIARLGNREIEGVLLELLEDVVILGSELADARKSLESTGATGT